MKMRTLKGLISASAVLLALCFTGSALAAPPPHQVNIKVGVTTNQLDQDVFAAARAEDRATATATAANGIASVTDSADKNVSANVMVTTSNVDQDALALAGGEGSSATADAVNAVASLSFSGGSGLSPAIDSGVNTLNVSQNAGAFAGSYESATASATAANGIVNITVH